VRSPEGAKRFVWGQLLVKCGHFGVSEDRRLRLLSRDPRNHETRYKYGERASINHFGKSVFRGSAVGESRDSEGEVAKSRVATESSEEFGISALRVSGYKGGIAWGVKSRSAKLSMRDTWQNHVVGPCDRQADMRHIVEGVNTLLTSRVSGIREIRARELDATTREVASSEGC
jgi:hypothetical protein